MEDKVQCVILNDLQNIHWMKHQYSDRWFADPFILNVDEENIILLVEEFCYSFSKGRIAKLVVSRKDYILKEMKIVLEEPYEYDLLTDSMIKNNDLSHLPLTDATVLHWNDTNYILSTKLPFPNDKDLYLFNFDYEKMVIDDKPVKKVKFGGKVARNAGEVFVVDGQYYRPAQDCNKNYGNGIVIQRIESVGERFLFSEVKTFFSTNKKMDLGYHTFNMYKGLIVVDGHGHRRKLLFMIYSILVNIKGMWKNKR